MTKYDEVGEQIKKRIQIMVLEFLLEKPEGMAQAELMRQIHLTWGGPIGENVEQYYMSAICEYLREKGFLSRNESGTRGKPYFISDDKKDSVKEYLRNLRNDITKDENNESEYNRENSTHVEDHTNITGKKINNDIFFKSYLSSLLSKPFTILAGNSGTGKTKIAKDLATWLGKPNPQDSKDIQNKLIVPVGADWTDNTKILGFYNPLKKTYESTKILDFILLARDNPDIPFFLILDEMNLSHVERYFSDFLSAMESHEKIILYSKEDECDSDIPDTIDLPENLFVTGTVNIDETTYMFSPKVLDRANVIEFIPEQSDVLANFENETQPDEIVPVNDGSAEGFLDLAKKVRSTTTLPAGSDKCKEILKSISDILEGSGFEFAFRTAKEIRLYINAANGLAQNEGKTLSENDYIKLMDEQLLQKILPKIHGNRSQVGTLLKNLSDFCDGKTVESNGNKIAGFTLPDSKKKLDKMLRQLETSQFTSFI